MKSLKTLLLAAIAGFTMLSLSFAGEAKNEKNCGDCQGCDHCCAAGEKKAEKTAASETKAGDAEKPAETKSVAVVAQK